MRTTIEIPNETRSKLLELAARRGEKGFSGIVQEALEEYFRSREHRQWEVERAVAALGTLSGEEADHLDRHVQDLRRTWR